MQQVLLIICGTDDLKSRKLALDLLLKLTICAISNRVAVSPEQHFYHGSDLRDFCGCLITVTDTIYSNHEFVLLAHYTVKEYLYSDRMRRGPASFFALSDLVVRVSFGKMMLKGVLELPGDHAERTGDDKLVARCHLELSVRVLDCWATEAAKDGEFSKLFWTILDPLRPHWNSLKVFVKNLLFDDLVHCSKGLNWRNFPEDTDVIILAHLLTLEGFKHTGGYTKPPLPDFSVATRFLENRNIETLIFEPCVDAALDYPLLNDASPQRPKSLMDFCYPWIRADSPEPFEFLLQIVSERMSPTARLLAYIGGHSCSLSCSGQECAIKSLLVPEADPDAVGFLITPLQIAVWRLDVCGVKCLLDAGASANATGSPFGQRPYMPRAFPPRMGDLWWNATPLRFVRYLTKLLPYDLVPEEEREERGQEIEQLLVQRGGIESFRMSEQ